MRLRSRILLTAGLACLSTAAVAGGALAHGGDHKSKFGKFSKRGHADLKVEVRGAITALTTDSITVSAAQAAQAPVDSVQLNGAPPAAAPTGLDWTCAIPAGSDVTGFAKDDIVKLACRSSNGVLTAYKLRSAGKSAAKLVQDRGHGKRGFSVEVEARGSVVLADQTSITVDPGTTTDALLPFTCQIGPRTRSFGVLAPNDIVKIECKSKHGALVAKKIKKKGAPKVGEIQVKVKAPIESFGANNSSITFVGGTTCAVSDPNLVTGLAPGNFVEAKCTGNPLTLVKIHTEDEDN